MDDLEVGQTWSYWDSFNDELDDLILSDIPLNTPPVIMPVARNPNSAGSGTTASETITCLRCSGLFPQDESVKCPSEEGYHCVLCHERLYQDCSCCGETTLRDDLRHIMNSYDSVCDSCFSDHYFNCNECAGNYLLDDSSSETDDDICFRCYNNRESEVYNADRPYHTGNNFVEAGKRVYSTEIECYGDDYKNMVAFSKEAKKEIGITHDGSLSSNERGKEIVTPKLSGKKGDDLLKETCSLLVKHKFTVDKTCGLHVHIDMTDIMGLTEIKTLLLFYLVFEPVIYSYLPLSRRKNNFCLPLSDFYHTKEIMACGNLDQIEAIWYREQDPRERKRIKTGKYHQSRYSGINLHSLFSHGHIEIRYHSGTIDYKKIRMWIDLHVAIINLIATRQVSYETLSEVKYIPALTEKQKLFFSLLKLPKNIEDYFKARQEKFGITTPENENICAE